MIVQGELTPLDYAGRQGHVSIVEALLNRETNLHAVNLSRSHLSREKALAVIAVLVRYPSISTLNLSSNGYRNEDAVAIARAVTEGVASITDLDLSDNAIDVAGGLALVEALSTNTTLTALNLEGQPAGRDPEVQAQLQALLERNRGLAMFGIGLK